MPLASNRERHARAVDEEPVVCMLPGACDRAILSMQESFSEGSTSGSGCEMRKAEVAQKSPSRGGGCRVSAPKQSSTSNGLTTKQFEDKVPIRELRNML